MAKQKQSPLQNCGMINSVFVSSAFKRDVKPLAKNYTSLKKSIDILIDKLKLNPYLGDNYGNGLFKVRLGDKIRVGAKAVDLESCIII